MATDITTFTDAELIDNYEAAKDNGIIAAKFNEPTEVQLRCDEWTGALGDEITRRGLVEEAD